MKKLSLLIIFLSLQSCYDFNCKIFDKCISTEDNLPEITDTFTLNDYKWYVFQMYESNKELFEDEASSQDLEFPCFDTTETFDSKIVEETYLLLPKDTTNNVVLYLTTFSHRHLYDECGVFNCPLLKNKIVFVEDIDMLYTGNLEENKIHFFDSSKKSENPDTQWNIELTDSILKIKNITLYPSTFKSTPQVDISAVFPFEMKFNLQPRTILYGKGDETYRYCFSECENSVDASKPQHKNVVTPITKISLGKRRFYFSNIKNNTTENYGFSRKRMPYVHR